MDHPCGGVIFVWALALGVWKYRPVPGLGWSMIALIVVEIAGTLVLLAGFVAGQLV